MENIPANITNTADKRGSSLPSAPPNMRTKNPTDSMTGNVPSQNASIIIAPFEGSADANARDKNVYNQPQGKNVVINPIKKGLNLVFIFSNGFDKFRTIFEVFSDAILEKMFLNPKSWIAPLIIKTVPAINAAELPNKILVSKTFPASAAINPSSVYVKSLPRLYKA